MKKQKAMKMEKIYSRDIMNDMISTLSSKVSNNNLEALKNHIENENSTIKKMQVAYNIIII